MDTHYKHGPTILREKLLAFDLDKTLLSLNISFSLGEKLYKANCISFFSVLCCLGLWIGHKLGCITTKWLHKAIFCLIFKGRKKQDVEHLAFQMFDTIASGKSLETLIRPSLMQEIAQERSRAILDGKHVSLAILSTSPDFLVEPFAKALSADWWQASIYHADENGFFDSLEWVVTGREKAKSLRVWTNKRMIEQSIICDTQAYTDSARDFPMLMEASCPVCVHPTIILRLIAFVKKWRIIEG